MKKVKLLCLILSLLFVITGCTNNNISKNSVPSEEDSVFDAVDGGTLDIDEVDASDPYEMEQFIKQIQAELGDNLTEKDIEKIKSLSLDKIKLLYEKHKALIASLEYEFDRSGISVQINGLTGEITVDAPILFGFDKSDLSDGGKEFLAEFVPIYASVVCNDEFSGFVSQVIIEGHTDTDGDYNYNLKLSKKRADSVKEFCISDECGVAEKNAEIFNDSLKSVGLSYDRPVYDEFGEVDKEASRRVSFRFMMDLETLLK